MDHHLFTVVDLGPEQFLRAYPLVQLSGAGLSLEQWLAFAHNRCSQASTAGGILSVQCAKNYIHALAVYDLPCKDGDRYVVRVKNFCALELFDRSAGQLLIETLERRGQLEGCAEIRIYPPGGAGMRPWRHHLIPELFTGRLDFVAADGRLFKKL